MSANIEALVKKHSRAFSGDVRGLRNALTEQAESFKGELAAYDGMVRELTKTVDDMRAGQSVPVVGEPVAFEAGFEWARMLTGHVHDGRDVCRTLTAHFWPAALRGIEVDGMAIKERAIVQAKAEIMRRLSLHAIPAAELATLREKAAEADELRKDAEKWRDLCSRVGADPSGIISYAGPLEGAPEDWAAIAQEKGE